MHIVNIMFSAIAGGIEQAFVDYTEGLIRRGHKVTAITHPDAVVNAQLKAIGIKPITMRNIGEWDPIAILRLKAKLKKLAPDIVIAQTTRSFTLAKRAMNNECPLVGVAHNYSPRMRRMIAANAVFTTTQDLIRFLMEQHIPEERIFLIPNMVRCDALPERGKRNDPPVIGTLGRFVKKKGFDIYIDALKLLHERGYKFKAVLGGDGEEAKHLKARAESAGLKNIFTFAGWIENKKEFYSKLDVFCLPSLHEPFGIVLLEAFIYGVPVVTTDTEGPRDIVTANFDAIVVKKDNAAELAAAIANLLNEVDFGATLATNGFVKAKTTYSLESVSERIEKALETIIARHQGKML